MAEVYLPGSLTSLFQGAPRRLSLEAGSVADVIGALEVRWPGMRDRLCEAGPRIREHMNVFVDGEKGQLETPLSPLAIVRIIPAVTGG